MNRELRKLAITVLLLAAVLSVPYIMSDLRIYGRGQAGILAGTRTLALFLAVMGGSMFLITGYAAASWRLSASRALGEARALGYDARLIGRELNIHAPLSSPHRQDWVFRYQPIVPAEQPPFPPGWELVTPSSEPLPTRLTVALLHAAHVHPGGPIVYESTGAAVRVRWDVSGWDVRGGGGVRTRNLCENLEGIMQAAG